MWRLWRTLWRTFIVIALARVAFGQASIYPQLIKLGAVTGSVTPVSDSAYLVTSGLVGQNLSFDLSIRYGGTYQGWLSVRPDYKTTATKLAITADPTNLPAGTYSAQIVASVGPLKIGAWTSVSFTVAPSTVNPAGVAVSPSGLTFLDQSLSPQTVSIANAPGVSGPLSFSVFANSSDWLTFTLSGQTTPASLTVQALPAGLSAGTHTGSVTITTSRGQSTVLPVALFVAQGTGPSITLTPAQRALTFNYQLNTTVNPQQTVFVSTASTFYTNFTATASFSWIGVSSTSYSPPSSTAACFAPGLLFVSVDPTRLTPGVYTGAVTLSAPGVSSVDIPISLTVSSTPVLNAAPSFVHLDSASNLLISNLAVTGSTPFYFTASVLAPWLSVTPATGVASPNAVNLVVVANVAGLQGGTYSTTITLTGSGGSPIQTIPVELQVAGQPPSNALKVAPLSLAFSGIAGTATQPQFVLITTGDSQLPCTAAAASDSGWLTVDPFIGTSPFLAKITVTGTAPAGSNTGSIAVTSLSTGDHATVAVTYAVKARVMTVTPATLKFEQQAVGATIGPQTVQVTANAPSTFLIASQPSWATVAPSTGLATPATLTVSVNPTGMAPGAYADNIVLSGPNDIVIPVALIIAAPAPPTVTPASLSFSYELGSPPPQAQTVQVASSSGTFSFSALPSTESGVQWLTIDRATGSTPGTITVSITVAQLVPGTHSGSIAVSVAASPSKTFTVPVTLTVTGSPVQVNAVLNAATLAPTMLSPGQIVTLIGFGFGPDTAVVAQPGAAGAFATQLAGTQVLFDGIAAPLLAIQGQQINAVAPYGLYGRTDANLQVHSAAGYSIPINVHVVAAAPGIFTSGSLGKGQAAALNADFTPNSVLNPAPRGSVIVIYLTGEGQTDPPGQDGRVIATDLRIPVLPVTALIGGQPAPVLYAGSSPSSVSGLCQVNLQIPNTLDPGTQPVEIQVGGIPTQRGVTIELR